MDATALLPALRDELALLPGPFAADGAPTWTLHDPLSNRYFRLSWTAFEILSRWHLGQVTAVADSVNAQTVLEVEPDDVTAVVAFLAHSQLLKADSPVGVERLLAIHDAGRTSWLTWLLHHYLFFRLPLVRPDSALERTLPLVVWLGSRAFRLVTLAALAAGLFLVTRQWESFAATFVDHFSLTGLAAFGVALGFAKVVHELGHAFTAKHHGCRVPSMGVAFLVLWPMLYTDVNEAWKLTDRRQRLLVGGAGILSELVIAAWATLAWGVLPDGTARSMAFTLAATTWISSLAINLSPFMRFDGYFLAMDALNQPNLHPRSFALARWHLRETLFALGEPAPEDVPAPTRRLMVAFAWAVWLYRLALFLGIAVLVYHFFIKAIGIILFTVEISWFVVKPVWSELREWRRRGGAIFARRRFRWPLGLLVLALLVLVLPWSGRVSAPALLKAERHVGVFAPFSARLAEIAVVDGQWVEAGTVLARLDNPDSHERLAQVERRAEVLKYELSAMGFEESFRSRSQATAEALEAVLGERAALVAEMARQSLTAPIAGTVTDLSPFFQPGQWVNPREPLLGLRRGAVIEAYVAEYDLPRLRVGAAASFIPEGSGPLVAATVAAIDRIAVKLLAEPVLAVQYGGDIPARFDNKGLVPDAAFYRVRLAIGEHDEVVVPVRGQAHLDGARRSLLGHALQGAAAILIREWGT